MTTTIEQNNSKKILDNPAEELRQKVEFLTKEIQELYLLDEIPWVLGYSGGKDSTSILQLVWNAIAQLPQKKRTKTISVITTDTLVENPIVAAWMRSSIEQIEKASMAQKMPIEPHLLHPEATETFWTGLIGKGYPPPKGKFRWCTERLKIKPSNNFIRNVIRQHGETILVLGIRKAESTARAARMNKWEKDKIRDRLAPNVYLPNSLVYSPVEDWSNDQVWMYLMQWDNPWGQSNKDLFSLYRGATADNECPLVVDTTTPSCGNSRFGCWVCTLVSQDKSLNAMVQNDEEKEWLQPLLDIRRDLDVQNNRDRRDFRRRNGNVQLYERNLDGATSIEPIPGPFTKEAREDWLRKILNAEIELRKNAPTEFKNISLITLEELSEIRHIWLEERHEFDDSLPKIYKEVTGEEFQDMRKGANENKILGDDEWEVLQEVCNDDVMHLELMTKLLDTERQFYTKARRVGIYESLTKCFDSSSRSREEAIAKAHDNKDIMDAAVKRDVETVKKKMQELAKPKQPQQLTWGAIKFAGSKDN